MSSLYTNNYLLALNKKKGLPPGSLIYTGKVEHNQVKIKCFSYDSSNFAEKEINPNTDFDSYTRKNGVEWINIVGLNNKDVYQKLMKTYGIHELTVEDIMNVYHRPKVEEQDNYLYVTLKMIKHDKETDKISLEQVSFILEHNHLISFQENELNIFDSIKERIRTSRGKVRLREADFLLYLLIDVIIDNYFSIIEYIGNKIDDMEENVLEEPPKNFLAEVQELKKQLALLRKAVFPLRELIKYLEKGESAYIKESTLKYFRDIYDTTISLADSIEVYRELLSSLKDIYLSSLNNRMNNVMKILTIISSVFIPLTFIAGVYGMNFKYMPELEYKLGYPIVMGVMVLCSISLIFFFKKKEWL